MSRTFSAMNSALVPLAVARQCLAPSRLAQIPSKFSAKRPPIRFQRPSFNTSIQEFSSFSRTLGQDGQRSALTGLPPSKAGFPSDFAGPPDATAAAAVEPARNLRLETF